MTTALYGGSFDPVHNGHLSVIGQGAARFDLLVVAVLANPAKRSGMFTVDDRVGLLEASVAHLDNVRVVARHGLIIDTAREFGATGLVRSIHKERPAEQSMAATNHMLGNIPTVYVTPEPSNTYISSTLVRELSSAGQLDAVADLVPPAVLRHLSNTTVSPTGGV